MNISTLSRYSAVLAILMLASQVSLAQNGSPNSSPSNTSGPQDCIVAPSNCNLNNTITDIVAPDSPAFTILGLSPTNTTSPNSPAQLAASALSAFDDNGHFQSGTAIDVVPFLIFKAKSFTLGEYAATGTKAYLVRVLSRTSVSFATTKGTSSPDTSIRMASGARISLIDLGDPRAAFQKCVNKINYHLDPSHPEITPPEIKQQLTQCGTDAAKKVWNATSLVIAGAPSWISTDGSTSSLKLNGGGYWVSFAKGLGTWGQLSVDARRETGQSVVPPGTSSSATNAFVLQDTTVAGGAFKFGRSDFNGIVEGLYIGKRTAGVPDSYPEFGFGIEKKLANKFYLEINYRYDVNSKQTSGILANLKWSFSQQDKLNPQGSQ
jgi:hypothetical protein